MTLELSHIGLGLGLLLMALHVPCLAAPAHARAALKAFPRHRVAAWVLTVIGVVWVSLLLYGWAWGRFEAYKPWIYGLAPLFIYLIGTRMDELLAARALGGLLMLLPSPMLDAARWHASPFRILVQVLAYVWAIEGAILMVSPFRLRRHLSGFVESDSRIRLLGAMGLGLGAALTLLGLSVY